MILKMCKKIGQGAWSGGGLEPLASGLYNSAYKIGGFLSLLSSLRSRCRALSSYPSAPVVGVLRTVRLFRLARYRPPTSTSSTITKSPARIGSQGAGLAADTQALAAFGENPLVLAHPPPSGPRAGNSPSDEQQRPEKLSITACRVDFRV
jgi:hypothetical protein